MNFKPAFFHLAWRQSRAFPLMDDREIVIETRVNTYYNLFYCVNLKISWYRWLRNSRVV